MSNLMVIKRNGEVVNFDSGRIGRAVTKAVIASQQELAQNVIDELVLDITNEVEMRFQEFFPNVENIQDIVEKHLVKKGLYEVAKSYILYRDRRKKEREEERKKTIQKSLLGKLTVKKRDGRTVMFDIKKISDTIKRVSKGFDTEISPELISKEVIKNIFDGISTEQIEKALILATISFIERDPSYNYASARLFLQKIYKEIIGTSIKNDSMGESYRETFKANIKNGVELGLYDERLLGFDLNKLAYGLKLERDELFEYMGIHTLYERYLMKDKERRIELPQAFWMRVAMGLAIDERDKNEKALEFYDLLSSLKFVSSTPTLFHSGTNHPQLSSCYLTTVNDDLTHIFKCLGDNAQLSKWSGGLGNDWTNIRATGSWIKSTNVESQGVIPFLKIANDVTTAINRSGKRRGATCAYLENWHLDFEDFLDLRKNTGDERRRTHDMNTASWIPDLFMKRIIADESWTLFSPEEVPELHHIYGSKFESKYTEYEQKARNGKIKKHKVVSAKKLWRKMLSMLFETGHPWITFKDPSNVRSPQDHMGVVHNSNLCTEITLNTSEDETAVCNLGSINISEHITREGGLDKESLAKTVKTAIRMLDNVIDINYYPTVEAKNSNLKHRPISLLEQERGMKIEVSKEGILDWTYVRNHVAEYGMRNSNTMAIAPTATISTISGCYPCIEPIYKNLYVKSNISGEFTIVNKYLVKDLKKRNLWNMEMFEQLKYYDGSVQLITSIPNELKKTYREVFEIDSEYLVQHAAVRGKWIDQSQSLNIFMKGSSGSKLNDVYVYAWKMGLKTTYYLRTLGASQIEKSTLDAKKYGYTQKREYQQMEKIEAPVEKKLAAVEVANACIISSDVNCEACQ